MLLNSGLVVAHNIITIMNESVIILILILTSLYVLRTYRQIFKESSVLAFLKSQNPGEKVFTYLTAIHVVVYLAWDITQRKHSIMLKYFVINEGNICSE